MLQSKTAAPIATVALLAAVLLHRRRHGAWPWPRGLALLAALLLLGWGAVSAAWAIEPGRALGTALQLGGFVALGAAAARAVAADEAAARDRLLLLAAMGLGLGLAAATADLASGHALRAAARGLKAVPDTLGFGLKPAASAMALWLPLAAAAAPLPRVVRAGLLAAGAAVLLALPGETARLAVLAAAAAGAATWLLPRLAPWLLGAGLAGAIVLMPALLGPALEHGVPAAGLPASAAHRLMIWDFVIGRIAEHPLRGWGMEASRRLPGGTEPLPPALLQRFGLEGPGVASWLPQAQQLPLHPHNGALQLWLELGLPGAVLGGLLALLLGYAARRLPRPEIGAAMLASGAVTAMLSFGAWQEWWIGATLLGLAGLAAVRPRG